jgi:hypothetical protein
MTSTPLTITLLRRHDEHTANYYTSEVVMTITPLTYISDAVMTSTPLTIIPLRRS